MSNQVKKNLSFSNLGSDQPNTIESAYVMQTLEDKSPKLHESSAKDSNKFKRRSLSKKRTSSLHRNSSLSNARHSSLSTCRDNKLSIK